MREQTALVVYSRYHEHRKFNVTFGSFIGSHKTSVYIRQCRNSITLYHTVLKKYYVISSHKSIKTIWMPSRYLVKKCVSSHYIAKNLVHPSNRHWCNRLFQTLKRPSKNCLPKLFALDMDQTNIFWYWKHHI